MAKRRHWSFSAGSKPHTVVVYEREPRGVLYARAWDASLSGGKGGRRRLSLGHRDKERARQYALDQAAKLRVGDSQLTEHAPQLSWVFDLYLRERSPRKSATEQKADRRRMEMWLRVLGDRDPHTISLRDWEGFIDSRTGGTILPNGRPSQKPRAVRARTVEADCNWLKWVFNWASKWRVSGGRYLMSENPLRGFDVPKEKNPLRPMATHDRFEAIQAVAEDHTMEIRWNGRRERGRSYLREILEIVNGTGRRISAVLALRFNDLVTDYGPHGAVRWPAETDKMGKETVVPISPRVRAAIDRVLRERPGIGATPLFPSPGDPTQPMSRHLADKWLREAERLAGLQSQKGSLWHAYRRKWATERKHLPDVDVAQAGGWSSLIALKSAYQQADPETMLEVVLGPVELREAR